jgi:exonuclease III
MNILWWNAPSLGASIKHRVLHDIVIDNKIDIVVIRETKN